MKKKLYAKHFEILFPDRTSSSQFYMISKYTKIFYATTLVQSKYARFRKAVTYIYLKDAINLAKGKIKNATLPRIKKAWINMLNKLNYIKNNYIDLYEATVNAKEHKYKAPSEHFLRRRKENYVLKQLRRQEFLKKWRKNYDKIFCL